MRWLFFLFLCSFILTNGVSAFINIPSRQERFYRQRNLLAAAARHVVDGIECVEVPIQIEIVGTVTILEATAESQEVLVDMALEEEEEEEEGSSDKDLALNSGDPYGAVLWPAASAIADRLLATSKSKTKKPLQGVSVLELGAGTGLVSISASLGGAEKVIATDYESVPLKLLDYAAESLNPVGAPIETAYFDICDFETPLPPADVVVAADVMYEPITGRAVARRCMEALRRGSRVLIGDSPGRAGRPAFLQELERLGLPPTVAAFTPVTGRTCSGPRHELICGKESSSVTDTPKELTVAILDLHPNVCLSKQ